MELKYHGGLCCGVKTLKGFYYYPETVLPAIEATKPTQDDIYGRNFHTEKNFFYRAAPEETALERLKRYISFMEAVRPQNLLEAFLIDSQLIKWEEDLRKLGFKKIVTFKNSNTGQWITLYHYYVGDCKKKRTVKNKIDKPLFLSYSI
jgi:hypothetical protein